MNSSPDPTDSAAPDADAPPEAGVPPSVEVEPAAASPEEPEAVSPDEPEAASPEEPEASSPQTQTPSEGEPGDGSSAADEAAPAAAPVAQPAPRPTPRPVPRPPAGVVPRPPAAGRPPAAVEPAPARDLSGHAAYGRVDEEGTVFVRTEDGERPVGQMPDATPEEALAFFSRKFDDLVVEVELLEQRMAAGTVAPDDATGALKKVRAAARDAHAVGDFAALRGRLEAVGREIAEQRERRRAERAERLAEAKAAKERVVEQAEKIAAGSEWRAGADRLRALLEEWKALDRLDRPTDDALWHRFSTARTAFTRRRKAHFNQLNEQREGARAVKEKLVKEAESIADSTDWGPTASAYRELMRRWKAAGPAPKTVDDELWGRFRAAQDRFFGARDAATAAVDEEYAANAVVKEQLLAEAEALLPVTDVGAAKAAFRVIAERWDAAGKVPRDRIKSLEGRMRKVEDAIRSKEQDAWRRSNPEARARASATVAQLEALIADLEGKRDAASERGDDRKAAEHQDAIDARLSWLAEARKALDEFS